MVNPKKEWKRKDNLEKLLILLKQHGELIFKSLKEKMEVSEPTLAEYIKILEQEKRIEHFFKSKDRRERWYRIRPESAKKVDAQLGKGVAVRFIEGIPNPVFYYSPGKISIAAFESVPATMNRNKSEEQIKSIVRNMARTSKIFNVIPSLKTDQKIAVVLMVEGKH